MSYSYKQWTQDQTADNVIHASDLERWQDGITDAGGTWSGSWTDEKDTLTADQLNALETEIASLYGTGFTAKTWEDGQVPGVDEWNRIEDAINTILNRTAFAIYCETDNSLTFYVDTEVPSVGDTYDGKVVAEVYTGLENTNFSSNGSELWANIQTDILSVVITRSFNLCKPKSYLRWFRNMANATFTGLEYINLSGTTTLERMFTNCSSWADLTPLSGWDVSHITTLSYMFYSCSGLTSLEPLANWNISSATNLSYIFYGCSGLTTLEPISGWDISSATNLSYMFYGCTGLTSVDEITTKWDFSNVTDIRQMFNTCSQLTTIDISKMNTAKVTNMSYLFTADTALATIYSDDDVFVTTAVTNSTGMFNGCYALVGGNGTVWNTNQTDASMAHIDTEDNPGYFTAKG